MTTVLDLNHDEARAYFMEEDNYVTVGLPPYFTFQELLNKTAIKIGKSNIMDFVRTESVGDGSKVRSMDPKNYEGVNYKLLAGKDGEFAWRPFEIIHPALYVALVNLITDKENWYDILSAFNRFNSADVACESIPVVSEDTQSHKAKQINKWWTNVEQASIKMGLKFQYVCDVDISDCYGSIYTHSITWALHGKETMKEALKHGSTSDYYGQKIDLLIQKMRYSQTNGIPQGSVIMDFIAEMLLGHIDVELTDRLGHINKDNFAIIRYRDDYKIFTNDPEQGREIVKELTKLLSEYGLKLNTSKTKIVSDPIVGSVKPDKLYELQLAKNKLSLSKRLLVMYGAINEYPNSGMSAKLLDSFHKQITAVKKLGQFDDVEVMISVVVNLATRNPRHHAVLMGILSNLLDFCKQDRKEELLADIMTKFERIPNTGLLDIWLQRVSYKIDPTLVFNEKLTKVVSGDLTTNLFWRSGWLKDELLGIVMDTSIIDRQKLETISPIVAPYEMSIFDVSYE